MSGLKFSLLTYEVYLAVYDAYVQVRMSDIIMMMIVNDIL